VKNRFFVALIFITSSAFAVASPEENEFSAKVSDVRLSSHLVEKGKTHDSTVSVKAKSVIYEPFLIIPDVSQFHRSDNKEVNIILEYFSSIIRMSPEEVLLKWHPAERDAKKSLIGTPEIFEQMKRYYTDNPKIEIAGVIYQAESASVLVTLRGFTAGHTLREHEGKLYLSDRPSNDLDLAIIEASYTRNIN